MQTLLKKPEVYSLYTILFALILKFSNLPFYEIPLIAACCFLALVYLKAGWKDWHAVFLNQELLLTWAGFCFALACMSFLAKFMYWPWAGLFNFIAFFPLLSVILLLRKQTEKNYHHHLRLRSIVFLVVLSVCILIPRDALIRLQHWNDPQYAALKIRYYNNPSDETLSKEYRAYKK